MRYLTSADHFAQLGELVSLDRLARVPAYQRWWADTRDALTEIGFRRAWSLGGDLGVSDVIHAG